MPVFDEWLQDVERRHLADLQFADVSRALRALSSAYVERRQRLHEGTALSGAGKRAAFALFYAPLHYLLVREIVESLGATLPPLLVDLGCGTGASGAAWAYAGGSRPAVVGIDRNRWALGEAAHTYRQFGLAARTRQGDFAAVPWPRGRAAFLAAFAINELSESQRDAVLERFLERAGRRDLILVVEPLAGFVAPWWKRWQRDFESAGGRTDEWRFRVELPAIVAKLDRAAGLNHRELTGRSLWIAPKPT
jgi:SAM-dependent methyltransferase